MILPERVFGQHVDERQLAQDGQRAELVAQRLPQLGGQLVGRLAAGLEHDERRDDLAAQLVRAARGAGLGDRRMAQERGLHLDRAEAVRGDLDDLVGTAGEEGVAVVVDVGRVAHPVRARDPAPVVRRVALRLAPERRRQARERPPDHHDPLLAARQLLAVEVDDRGLDARQRQAGRARLDRHQLDAVRVAEDRAAGLRLPHVVDDRDAVVEDRSSGATPRPAD